MDGIFISYRRQDAGGHAGRLRDHLRARFGARVFQDVDDIPDGEVFEQVLGRALNACRVGLVVIGPNWLTGTDAEGRRRLDSPDDWVREEIQQLIRRDIRVIPVLVGGARLPAAAELPETLRPLCKRQARELRDASWDVDVAALIRRLDEVLQDASIAPVPAAAPQAGRRGPITIAAGVLVAIIAGAAWMGISSRQASPSSADSTVGAAAQSSAVAAVDATVAAAQALQIVGSRWRVEDFSGMPPAADPSTVYQIVVDKSTVRLQPTNGAAAPSSVARQIVGRALTLQSVPPAGGAPLPYLYVFQLAADESRLDDCQTVNAADLRALGPCQWRYHRVPEAGLAPAALQPAPTPVTCGRGLPSQADPKCVAKAAGLIGPWTGDDGHMDYRLRVDGDFVELLAPSPRDEKSGRLLLRGVEKGTVSFAWAGFQDPVGRFDAQSWLEYELVADKSGLRLVKCGAALQLSAHREYSQCTGVPAFLVQRTTR